MRIEDFWTAYLSTLTNSHLHTFLALPDAWCFGNSEEMADRLGNLVFKGMKTATCSAYLGTNILEDGGLNIILDGRNEPLCIIETSEITIRQYQDIDAEWAKSESEGDLSLTFWREGHWKFFTQDSKQEGYSVSKEMLLSCERFTLVFPLPVLK